MPVVQVPTTLPTLDEMIGLDGCTPENVADRLLSQTANARRDHVFTLHAELEGMAMLPVMERLITGWREQGYELIGTGQYVDGLDLDALPFCELEWGTLGGRSGTLLKQGSPYLVSLEHTLRR